MFQRGNSNTTSPGAAVLAAHDAVPHRPLPVTQATLVNGVRAANSVAAPLAAAACVAVVAGAVAEAAATVEARLARMPGQVWLVQLS